MKISMCTIAFAVALSPMVLAQERPDRGEADGANAPDARDVREPRGERRPFGGRLGFSEREQEEMVAFMKQFAPNRWAAMEAMPSDGAFRRGAMAFAAARWRHLQMLQDEDPQLYDIKLRQFIIEDNIFGLLGPARTLDERLPQRKKLREQVSELVKQGLAERERRIGRLRKEIKAEEERLANDHANIEALIDRRTDAYITEGPSPQRPEGGLRRPLRHDGPASRPAADRP